MSIILYIRGQQVDLEPSNVIAQTKQINDIASIQKREANHTNTFKLPKTANNVRVMSFMTLAGNTSRTQYQKNECSMFSAETGECFINKGWATIKDEGSHYNVYVIDGIIDFYKEIENKTLSDLAGRGTDDIDYLAELKHLKTIENVIASWDGEKPYRYILADYNGDTGNTSANEINIDYLVPSVSVAFLWQKIFEKFHFTYSGSVFDMQVFKNLWMTFPKGLATSDSELLIFEADFDKYQESHNGLNYRYFPKYTEAETVPEYLESNVNQIHLKIAQAGTYRVVVTGNIAGKSFFPPGSNKPIMMTYSFNAEGQTPNSVNVAGIIHDAIPSNDSVEKEKIIDTLTDHTSICFILSQSPTVSYSNGFYIDWESTNLNIKIYKVNQNDIDFEDALIDFSMKDFINEIVNRFGLSIYPDNRTKNYEFLTLQEIIQGAPLVNWSDKLVSKISENYIYGSYAQRNWFRYNYNDKEATYNDWFIDVNNVNLPDSRDTIKSRIYSPESQYNRVSYLNRGTNVYKLWDKEPATDPETGEDLTTYKSLDKRYYFLRAERHTGSLTMISKTLEQSVPYTGTYYLENYLKLPWFDIIQDFYRPLEQVLQDAMLVNVNLWLSDHDIASFDFRKLYYFEQLSNYFMVNRIENFVNGRPTKVELVRVLYDEPAPIVPDIRITKVVTNDYTASVHFSLAVPMPNLTFYYKRAVDSGWSSIVFPYTSNPWNYPLSPPGTWEVKIKAGDVESNVVQFEIPSNTEIIT